MKSCSENKSQPVKSDHPVVWFHLTGTAMIVLATVILAPWVAAALLFLKSSEHPVCRDQTPATAATVFPGVEIDRGPWGVLEIEPIVIEPKETFFNPEPSIGRYRKWELPETRLDTFLQFLEKAGLEKSEARNFCRSAVFDNEKNILSIEPPPDIVKGLTPEKRGNLYKAASRCFPTAAHGEFFYFKGDVHGWFAKSGLPGEIVDMVSAYSFFAGPLVCFSDMQLVMPAIESPLKKVRFQQTIARSSTLSLRLKVEEDADISSLARYWAREHNDSPVEAILQSIANRKGGGAIDVVYFFPPFARTRLYSYLNPTVVGDGLQRDCHWTAFNFFNETPDDRLADVDYIQENIRRYEKARGALRFGDIINFIDQNDFVVHACVYIAADIVFTKNGTGAENPFILERMADTKALYEAKNGPLKTLYFRKKHGGQNI